MIFNEGKDEAIWEKIRTDESYEKCRSQLKMWYDKYCTHPMQMLPYSSFTEYRDTGNRVNYEHLYFAHRARLAVSFLYYMIYRTDEYKRLLCDTVWGICDEYCWCLSAHIRDWSRLDEEQRRWIDLFASETGAALAEIKALAPQALDDTIKKRIHRELTERILIPYQNNDFYWEHWAENWNAVCTGSVAICIMYEFPELAKSFEKRWLDAMDIFLEEFGDDGCCTEGISYWTYGFGYFVYFAAAYRQFTGGKIDLFKKDIVGKTARFQQNMFLCTGDAVNFADCEDYSACYDGITNFLCAEYEDVSPPNTKTTILNFEHMECFSLIPLIRNFVWSKNDKSGGANDFYYYKNTGWYIRNTDKIGFAAKCGNNDEAHNHNDVGSFILSTKTGAKVIDLGSGVYDKDYFSKDGRYNIINCSSKGHSAPIINSEAQKEGKEYRGEVIKVDKTTFYMDISGAYEKGISFKRKFTVYESSVTMEDNFSGNVCDRIILSAEPQKISGGAFRAGDLVIKIDKDDVTVTKLDYFKHDGTKSECFALDIHATDGCKIIFEAE